MILLTSMMTIDILQLCMIMRTILPGEVQLWGPSSPIRLHDYHSYDGVFDNVFFKIGMMRTTIRIYNDQNHPEDTATIIRVIMQTVTMIKIITIISMTAINDYSKNHDDCVPKSPPVSSHSTEYPASFLKIDNLQLMLIYQITMLRNTFLMS